VCLSGTRLGNRFLVLGFLRAAARRRRPPACGTGGLLGRGARVRVCRDLAQQRLRQAHPCFQLKACIASCPRGSPALKCAELRVELHGALELYCICGVAYFARS
jgi:hypothetical protein